MLSIVLIFFENTVYTIPILSGFLFIISNSTITFDTLNTFGLPHIVVMLVLLSFIIHLIRFKPKLKMGKLFLGLLLISISYLIPLIYTDVTLKAIAVSGVGLIYFIFYVFLFSTAKPKIRYLFNLLLVVNVLLVLQLMTKIYRGVLDHPNLNFIEVLNWGMNNNWGPNFGWANINDVAFYLVLTLPVYIYLIFKRPHNVFYWFLLLIPMTMLGLSGSRGGMIGFAVVLGLLFCFMLIHGSKSHYISLGIGIFIGVIAFIAGFDFFKQTWIVFLDTLERGSINSISSSRIFIYQKGIEIFKMHPIFGSGWMSIDLVNADQPWWRLFMYHSTIIQALAAMGIFGLIALLIHYFQVFSVLFNNFTLEKQLIFIGYIATQIHGLIDNVQYSVPYSFLIVYIFVMIEKSDVETVFRKEGRKFIYDPNLDIHD
jgi:O-antigen ligase